MVNDKKVKFCPKCKDKLQIEKKKFWFVKCVKCKCEAVAVDIDTLHLGGWRYVD